MRAHTSKICLRLFPFLLLCLAAPAPAQVEFGFLAQQPQIDGQLDSMVAALPVHSFPVVDKPQGTDLSAVPTYRLGYGTNFLYIYIDTPQRSLTTRDRAYQNGDGVEMSIVTPTSDGSASRSFYVLGFTASDHPTAAWQQKFVWYHDVGLVMKPLEHALIAAHSAGEHTGIEILIPWSELPPYHPWLSEQIGFNLCYLHAVGEKSVASYSLLNDELLQSEQSSRLYLPAHFVAPVATEKVQSFAALRTGHLMAGHDAVADYAVLAPRAQSLTLNANIHYGEGGVAEKVASTVDVPARLSRQQLVLPTGALPPGGYSIEFKEPAGVNSQGLTIFSDFSLTAARTQLERMQKTFSAGSLATLRFQLDNIEHSLAALQAYQSAPQLRASMTDVERTLAAAAQGEDLLARRTGIFRRAHLSKIDGSYQPYTIFVPANLDRTRRYPLIVFLHGSGEDDTTALHPTNFPKNAILVAPFARGTSNAYTADHAQEEIAEVIDDVQANYPIDTQRVLLSGFSMGGYGVYRTFYETPQRFRAIAVFSGHPSFGKEVAGADAPDFLDEKNLKPFAGVPIFIFHGGRDRNCPIELTRELVDKLQKAGAHVHFDYEADKGHESPSPQTHSDFLAWYEKVMN